jgi:hypothetical protein
VQIIEHLIIENNLYIVSEQCQNTLRQLVQQVVYENFRIEASLNINSTHSQPLSESDSQHSFNAMLVVHDCLRILKYLSLTSPTEELLFSEDNLLI